MKKTQYAVQINNQQEFDQLMEYYDRVGWKWIGNTDPKKFKPAFLKWSWDSPVYIFFYDQFTWETGYRKSAKRRLTTLSQAKEKIRHMKAYKEWSSKQKLASYPSTADVAEGFENPEQLLKSIGKLNGDNFNFSENKIDYSKIKSGDKVLFEVEVADVDIDNDILNVYDGDGAYYYFNLNAIKKHIPVRSELEVAEEDAFNYIQDITGRGNNSKDLEILFDKYYQARKKVEELKNYEEINGKF